MKVFRLLPDGSTGVTVGRVAEIHDMGSGEDPVILVDPLDGSPRINVSPKAVEQSDGKARLGQPLDKKSVSPVEFAGVPDLVIDASWKDIVNDRVPGFTTDANDKSGVNPSYWLTDSSTGHRFLVKREDEESPYGDEYHPVENEVWTSQLAQQIGLKSPTAVQSRADSRMSIFAHVNDEFGTELLGSYWDEADFQEVRLANGADTVLEALNLRDSTDIVKMTLMDALIGNRDRHGANWMISKGSDGKNDINPIDHGLLFPENAYDYFNDFRKVESVRLTHHLFDKLGESRFRQIATDVVTALESARVGAPPVVVDGIDAQVGQFDTVEEIVNDLVQQFKLSAMYN